MKLPSARHALSHRAINRGTAPAFAFFGNPSPATFAWHSHRKHQFLTVGNGLAYVQTPEGMAVVTPWRGVLIPAGVRHETRVEADCRHRSIFFDPRRHSLRHKLANSVAISDLLAHMVEHCDRWTDTARSAPRSRRFFAALWDVAMESARPFETLAVPVELSSEWRDTIAHVLGNLADIDLPQAAARHGLLPRTFRRRFSDTFGCDWRRYLRTLRVTRALQLLQSGRTNVSEAAFAVGFGSLSAFNATFRAVHGRNPGDVARLAAAQAAR